MSIKKKPLIIGGVVVVVLVALALVGLQVVNSRIEEEVSGRLDSAIKQSEMEEFVSYEKVNASAAQGKIDVMEVRFDSVPGMGSSMKAERLSIKVPPGEAVSFINDPQGATLSTAGVKARNMSMKNEQSGDSFEIGSLNFTAEGELGRELMSMSPLLIMDRLSSMELHVKDTVFTPGRGFMQQMQTVPGARALVAEGALEVKSMDLDMDLSPSKMSVKELAIDSGLMTIDGNMDMDFDEMMKTKAVSGKIDFEKLHEEMRKNLTAIFAGMGAEIPEEGAFTLDFNFPEDGMPSVTVE